MIYNSTEELIGNTPLLKLDPNIHGLKNIDLYAKLEYMNAFGSVKDRIAKGMLAPIMSELKEKNMTVLEASSGNTAKALSILASMNGLSFKTVTNRIKNPEVRMILQTLGAQIEELPGLSDCPDPLDPNDFTTVAANMAKQNPEKYHYTDQYFNELNIGTHYATTGKEIHDDLGPVDFYFGFLGTCGSSMGVGKYLREKNPASKIFGVVASVGHHVPGGRNINELWEVGFFQKDFFEKIIDGTSNEAIEGMLTLNRRAGMLCGPTSGLTFHAAVNELREIDAKLDGSKKYKAVFIACDRMEPYMSYIKSRKPELFMVETSSRPTVNNLTEGEVLGANILSANELNALDRQKTMIVDVRGYFAYSIGHISDAINILDEVFAKIIEEGKTLPTDKKIVIVCASGNISKKYAAFLQKQGYDAYSLSGGMASWKGAGLPLQKN